MFIFEDKIVCVLFQSIFLLFFFFTISTRGFQRRKSTFLNIAHISYTFLKYLMIFRSSIQQIQSESNQTSWFPESLREIYGGLAIS
jgi:hypothetical protein